MSEERLTGTRRWDHRRFYRDHLRDVAREMADLGPFYQGAAIQETFIRTMEILRRPSPGEARDPQDVLDVVVHQVRDIYRGEGSAALEEFLARVNGLDQEGLNTLMTEVRGDCPAGGRVQRSLMDPTQAPDPSLMQHIDGCPACRGLYDHLVLAERALEALSTGRSPREPTEAEERRLEGEFFRHHSAKSRLVLPLLALMVLVMSVALSYGLRPQRSIDNLLEDQTPGQVTLEVVSPGRAAAAREESLIYAGDRVSFRASVADRRIERLLLLALGPRGQVSWIDLGEGPGQASEMRPGWRSKVVGPVWTVPDLLPQGALILAVLGTKKLTAEAVLSWVTTSPSLKSIPGGGIVVQVIGKVGSWRE